MSSKPQQPAVAPASPIPDVLPGGVVEFSGPDAEAFLQAQTMNDVRALGDMAWQWNGWLTAKGRVVALFALLRLDPQRYWALLPDHPAAALQSDLSRFRFRSRVTLDARNDLRSRGFAQPPGELGYSALHHRATQDSAQVCCLDFSGESARSLLIGSSHALAPVVAVPSHQPMSPQAWAVQDIAHGLPRLATDSDTGFTPQMLSLDRIGGYSVKKGCYPGQEIVARTHFLGQAKRNAQRLRSEHALIVGDSLLADNRVATQVLCAASDTIRHESLAVLPVAEGETYLTNARTGDAVVAIPFAAGLAR